METFEGGKMSDLVLFNETNLKMLQEATARFAKSSVVPYAYRGKPAEIFSILCLGQEMGIGPMQSLLQIYSVNGMPSLSTKLKLSIAKREVPGLKVRIESDHDKKEVTCYMALPDGSIAFKSVWNLERAELMGLTTKKGSQYKTQPMTMLQYRTISECLNIVVPEAACGIHTTEELHDFSGKPTIIKSETELINEDFPIEPEKLEVGSPEFLFQNGKFKDKQMKDVDTKELEDYIELLEKRHGSPSQKRWDEGVLLSMNLYLERLETDDINQ